MIDEEVDLDYILRTSDSEIRYVSLLISINLICEKNHKFDFFAEETILYGNFEVLAFKTSKG